MAELSFDIFVRYFNLHFFTEALNNDARDNAALGGFADIFFPLFFLLTLSLEPILKFHLASLQVAEEILTHSFNLFLNESLWSFSLGAFNQLAKEQILVAVVCLLLSLLFEILANILAEVFKIIEGASLLGELVVDSWILNFVNLLQENFEDSLCAGKLLVAVIFWEGKIQIKCITNFVANDAFFETWDKLLRTKLELEILGAATSEFNAVFFASEVDNNFVTVLCGTLNNASLSKAFGDAVQNVFDIVFGDGLNRIIYIEILVIAEFNLWHNICLDCKLSAFAWNELHNVNVRDGNWSKLFLSEKLRNSLTNKDIQSLTCELVWIDVLFDNVSWGAAFAEASNLNIASEALQSFQTRRLKVLGSKFDGEFSRGVSFLNR